MLLMLVGRLVSIMIDICKKQNWGGGVCVLGGGGGGMGERRGDKKERKGRGRWGEGEGRKGKGKEILMFRGQENILNGSRNKFARWEFPQRSPWLWFYVVCTPNVVCYVTDVVAVYKISVFSAHCPY